MDFSGLVGHYPKLLRDARRIVGNVDDAQEIAQQTVCDAMACCHELRDPSRLAGWLRVINRRNALDLFKVRRRQRKCLMNYVEAARPPQPAVQDYKEVVSIAIARLNSRDKFVLEERYLNGVGIAEIGLKLGASPGAVRTSLVRARRKLHHVLRNSPME